jgi:NADP-dependent aldehyde dehydrogenase
MANARKNPIPFFGELGSINPVAVLDSALGDRSAFAKNYLDSLLMGNGQFCTNPSILFIPDDPALISEIRSQIAERDSQPFLTNATKILHDENRRNLIAALECEKFEGINTNSAGFYSSPEVLITSVTKALTTSVPFEIECFGPTGIILTYSNHNELLDGIARIDGALSSSIFASEQDVEVASVMESLKERSGRIAWNAWPTGVAVTQGQHHGGPYPAATNASATSVGIDAIYRFLRPVTFQGIPSGLG